MKTPEQIKNIEQIIKKNADKPQWIKDKPTKSNLVGISVRIDKDLKEKLERKARENKINREYPYSLTDFIIKALNDYVENNKDYFD